MAEMHDEEDASVSTNSDSYKKLLSWEIENFEDWWSSRMVAQSEREGNASSTTGEETQIEIPKNWRKSSHSPPINFIVEGHRHELEISVLKYDSYDRYDNDHNLMMGISIYYKGPSESIIIKPLFFIKGIEPDHDKSIVAKELKKGAYSECKVFNNHGIITNKDLLLTEGRLTFQCILHIITFSDFSGILQLERNLQERKTWNQYLSDYWDLDRRESKLNEFSDFEIICVEEGEGGEKSETRFQCHKLVLFLGTNYYKKMFSSNFTESEGTATVTDVSSKTMKTLLEFLYCGEVKQSDIDIELLLTADKYEIEHLHSLCELELGRNITVETATDLSVVGAMCGSKCFKTHVYSFVRKHWKEISARSQSELIRTNSRILCEIWDTL